MDRQTSGRTNMLVENININTKVVEKMYKNDKQKNI